MEIEELRRQIDSGKFKLANSCNCIKSGNLIDSEGKSVEYEINHGWDILSATSCDCQWASFNMKLFEYIKEQDYSEQELETVLSGIQIEHLHWNWFKKSVCYTSDGYEWFYFFADEKPQGASLIYHPKDSIIDSENIFYMEFLEVAPWNRDNPIAKRKFKGIGSLIIKHVLNFAVNKLRLKPGFSLHSLPQSIDYYKKIGMVNYPERNDKDLAYFEMSRTKSKEMLGIV